MKNEYRIGAYVFHTYEEYRDGLDDVNTIRYIVENVDIEDPDVVLHLYDWMKNEKLVLKSPIGEAFYADVVERVANYSQKQLEEDKKEVVKKKKSDRLQKYGGIICIGIAMVCFLIYFGLEYSNYKGNKETQHLQELKQQALDEMPTARLGDAREVSEEETTETEGAEESQEPVILPEYSAIYEENNDFVGWLKIDDTIIDYPVMQSKNDEDYYLTHTFSREEDKNGTLFIDARNDIVNRSTNIIIYGHNMRSSAMFGSLKKYMDESYWQAHKTIQFDTIYEKGTYEVVAVCLGKVEYQDEDVFRYYDFLNAENEEQFDTFLKNIEESAAFADENAISYGDKLLTLSTCNNYVENGRLYIVAKEVTEQ